MKRSLTLLILLVSVLSGCSLFSRRTTTTSETPQSEALSEPSSVEVELPSPPEESTIYRVDPQSSTLAWIGRLGPITNTGTVDLSQGIIWQTQTDQIGGRVIIDMATITSEGNQLLVDFLKGEEAFAVQSHPAAIIDLKTVQPLEENPQEYRITADLTVKGITQPIEFTAQTENNSGQILINAALSIDRTRWDLTFTTPDTYLDISDDAISDEIGFVLTLVANQETITTQL